jgi:hypothetical protein
MRTAMFFIGFAASFPALIELRHCQAAGAKAEFGDVPTLVAEAEKLLPSLVDVQERLRLSCVVAYFKLRGRPDVARLRFQEILAEIDAAAKRSKVGEGDRRDWIDAHGVRVGLAEWMARSGLRDEARTLLIAEENEFMATQRGLGKAWNVLDAVPRFVALGLDAEALAYLKAIEDEDEWESRDHLSALVAAVHAARGRGDDVAAAAWFKEALEYFRTQKFSEFTPHREIIRAATTQRAEREIKEVVQEAERAKQPPEFALGIQLDYLSWLVAAGRTPEARAIVARYESDPIPKLFVGVYATTLAIVGDEQGAEKAILAPRPDVFDERLQQLVYFSNLSDELLRIGRFAAAKRFRRESAARASVSTDDAKLSPEALWLDRREERYNDAAFAVACGETGALVKLATDQKYSDEWSSEFACKCYLATALAVEPPHEHAPQFSTTMAHYFGFHLFHK